MCTECCGCDGHVLGEAGGDWMAVEMICKVLGHKKTMKIETKEREDMISAVLAHHQASNKELWGS